MKRKRCGGGRDKVEASGVDVGQNEDELHRDSVEGVEVNEAGKGVLLEVRDDRRWVGRRRLATFCGFAVSMSLPIPLSILYTKSPYNGLSDWKRVREREARDLEISHLSN